LGLRISDLYWPEGISCNSNDTAHDVQVQASFRRGLAPRVSRVPGARHTHLQPAQALDIVGDERD